jgi:CTP:molybdopterin cytidylyltransferase MocA
MEHDTSSMIQEKPTAGIILAAGTSTRLGQPKQLLRLKDKYLIEWVLDAALNSRLSRIVLVLGYSHQKILQALGKKSQHPRLYIKINPQYKEGQGHSLRTGLSTVKDDSPTRISAFPLTGEREKPPLYLAADITDI